MGFDKARLDFHGETQVSWLYKMLQPFCQDVFVSADPSKISGNFNFIKDHYQTGGPMNGILSAFLLLPTATWIVVPVDMPNVDAATIFYLIENHHDNKPATCFLSNDKNWPETFPVILTPSAYPMLVDRFKLNDASLNGFLRTTDSVHIKPKNRDWLSNINSFPDTFEKPKS